MLLAYSGGLDSTLCIDLLRRVYRAQQVHLVLFDVGQGAAEVDRALQYAKRLGAAQPEIVDIRSEMYEDWLVRAVRANASFRGYPIAAPIAKQLIACHLARLATARGIDAIAEGSSGRGNDQFRMHAPVALIAPGLRVIAPIRDLDLTRTEETVLCEAWGIPYNASLPVGGDDVTAWCRSIASGGIGLDDVISDDVWCWYRAPAVHTSPPPLEVHLGFDQGVPVSLDGKVLSLREIVTCLNPIAGERGVGYVDILEDSILGLKSREIYEAPGATVILAAHRDLEHLCLTGAELEFKAGVDARWLQMVYSGHAFHPLVEALDAFIASCEGMVTGEVKLRLYAGSAVVVHRNSPTPLYQRELRDITHRAFDQRRMQGAVFAHGLPYHALHTRRH